MSCRYFVQGVVDLDSFLTVDGLKRLKLMCFKNPDFKAKSQDEVELPDMSMKLAYTTNFITLEIGLFAIFEYGITASFLK